MNFVDPLGLDDFPIPWWTNPDGSIGTGFDLPGPTVYSGSGGGIGGGFGGRSTHGPLLDTGNEPGGGTPQNPGRPEKKPNFLVVAKKGYRTYEECVQYQWEVFNQAVENVKKPAAKEADRWRMRWLIWQSLGELFKPGPFREPSSTDIISQGVVDGYGNSAIRTGEAQAVEKGTQKAAENRNEAIKNNCKKPT